MKICRLLSIVLMVFSSSAVFAANLSSTCEELLAPSMKTIYRHSLRMGPHHLDSGLPEAQPEGPIRPLGDGRVSFHSDLGPSIWDKNDFWTWMKLDEALENLETASAAVSKITSEAGHCPGGLSTYLCSQLRKSRQIQTWAVREAKKKPLLAKNIDDIMIEMKGRINKLSRDEHDRTETLRFAFGIQSDTTDGLSEWQAMEILRMLTRETLIRHLEFKMEGRTYKGRDLDLDTRIWLATAPALTGMIPFFQKYPLQLTTDEPIGSSDFSDSVPLIDWHTVETNSTIETGLVANLDTSIGPDGEMDIAFHITIEDELDEVEFIAQEKSMKASIQKTLNALAADFAREMDIPQGFKVKTTWLEYPPELKVEVKGANLPTQIAFVYYLKQKMPRPVKEPNQF